MINVSIVILNYVLAVLTLVEILASLEMMRMMRKMRKMRRIVKMVTWILKANLKKGWHDSPRGTLKRRWPKEKLPENSWVSIQRDLTIIKMPYFVTFPSSV